MDTPTTTTAEEVQVVLTDGPHGTAALDATLLEVARETAARATGDDVPADAPIDNSSS
jgi:hypothetical protein